MVTFLYAGILGLLYVALTFYTIAGRFKHHVNLGHGENDDMLRRIRVHGNFAEYVPFCLVLMFLYESMSMSGLYLLHIIGVALVLSRVIFSVTVLKLVNIPYGRQIGMIMTLGILIILSIRGIYGFIG